MTSEKFLHTARYDTSSRLHIIVLYLLVASLTIAWGIYFVHFSRNVQAHVDSTHVQLNLIKERLAVLESSQITVSTSANGYEALRRQARYARIKAKTPGKQTAKKPELTSPADLLFGSIQFKIPVRSVVRMRREERSFY